MSYDVISNVHYSFFEYRTHRFYIVSEDVADSSLRENDGRMVKTHYLRIIGTYDNFLKDICSSAPQAEGGCYRLGNKIPSAESWIIYHKNKFKKAIQLDENTIIHKDVFLGCLIAEDVLKIEKLSELVKLTKVRFYGDDYIHTSCNITIKEMMIAYYAYQSLRRKRIQSLRRKCIEYYLTILLYENRELLDAIKTIVEG